MTNPIANTKTNNIIVSCLKKVKGTQWAGNLTFDSMDKAITSIMLNTSNSGWYSPVPFRIKGVHGWFVANENGQILFECRIIKKEDDLYLIEEMTMAAFNQFEINFRNELNNA